MAYPIPLHVIKSPGEKDLMLALFDGVFRRPVSFLLAAYPDGDRAGIPLGQTQFVEVFVSGVDREGPDDWAVRTAWKGDFHVEIKFSTQTRMGFVSMKSLIVNEDGKVWTPSGTRRLAGNLHEPEGFESVNSRAKS